MLSYPAGQVTVTVKAPGLLTSPAASRAVHVTSVLPRGKAVLPDATGALRPLPPRGAVQLMLMPAEGVALSQTVIAGKAAAALPAFGAAVATTPLGCVRLMVSSGA